MCESLYACVVCVLFISMWYACECESVYVCMWYVHACTYACDYGMCMSVCGCVVCMHMSV